MKVRFCVLAVLTAAFIPAYPRPLPEGKGVETDGVITLTYGNFRVVVPDGECSQVRLAADALCRDFGKVMEPPSDSSEGESEGGLSIVVVNEATPGAVDLLTVRKPLDGFESHRIYCDAAANRIYLHGKDMRGTIYAIYSFSEQVLGVPPLWYWCDWKPELRETIDVPADYDYYQPSPTVRYRAWFPNDEDLFVPWRRKSAENNEQWLETMLRLKLNTVEYTATVTTNGTLNSEAMLYKKYGLVLTSHHMVALNNSFANWDAYWQQVRKTTPPALSVNNMTALREFWQYNINSVMNSGVENLWQVAFRGKTDQPFWAVFTDAPTTDKERAEVINRMVKEQYDMICASTGEENPFVRMTFYDEISTLMAAGYLKPPSATNMLWTFVAGRRDHYPYDDLVNWTNTDNVKLGYYMNLQFYSTGAHLAPAEGPWKMEDNYRYVQGKGPLTFSVVNAGNLREFLMEMSANAAMMWNSETYTTDNFLLGFCRQYFGEEHAAEAAQLYRDFYYSYWNPKKSDFPGGFDRQYVFQDLRHSQVIKQVNNTWGTFKANPLTEIGYESVAGRSFRIEGSNQVDSILAGTAREAEAFASVAARCEALQAQLPTACQIFFYDHLSAYAHYMANLSRATYEFVYAYKNKNDDRLGHLSAAYEAMKAAKEALLQSQHDVFASWYATDDKFEMDARIDAIHSRMMEEDDVTLTEQLIENYDFEYGHDCQLNPVGNISRGIPCGWTAVGELKKGSNGLDSYGVNQGAANYHGNNVCWINSVPMPGYFELSQTIPAAKLTPGRYLVQCKLWVENGKKTSCRLFANNNVQYYGYESDYTNLLAEGENATYAGYAGGNTTDFVLKDMEVYVDVADDEDLTIGIKTGNRKNDGTTASDNAGWFKVDFFRIHRVGGNPDPNPVPDTTAPVLIVCGQSNSDGRVPNIDYPDYMQTDQCLYCYDDGSHFQNGQFKPYTPYTHVAGDSERFGYDAFVYHYLQKSLRQPFYVVKLTLGGTAIDPSCTNSNGGKFWSCDPTWYDNQAATSLGGKSLMKAFERSFEACRTQTLDALEKGYKVKAILWHQGESDYSAQGPVNYYDNLTTLITHMRQFLYEQTGDDGCRSLPFILGTVSHISKQYNADVEAAHLRIAAEDENVYAIDLGNRSLLGDDLHFNVESAEYYGQQVFRQLVELRVCDDVDSEEDTQITDRVMVNPDFELDLSGNENPRGNVCRGVPYGWSIKETLNGNSYGINKDAVNFSGNNVCWMNSTPMPDGFELSQTIPAAKLGKGRYTVKCKLWVGLNKKTSCRLFAAPLSSPTVVQYYGYESDYTNLLAEGENATYAGYAGGADNNFILRPMSVTVELQDGEGLTVGIRTGNLRNNGQHSTDNSGWFKVDNFRIYKEETTGINSVHSSESIVHSSLIPHPSSIYDLQGRRVANNYELCTMNYALPKGIYITNGKKIIIK